MPTGDRVVNILLGGYSITWEKCSNIEISSITFQLTNNFIFSIMFNQTSLSMSNISIFGNGYSGCSSTISLQSSISVTNSKFIGIQGWLGAAVMILTSYITFTGNNTFADNSASSGGGIYLHQSTLILTGTNLFTNNTSIFKKQGYTECNYPMTSWEQKILDTGHGGAIYSSICNITFNAHLCFTMNTAYDSGGALSVESGSVTIQGTILLI